MSKIAPKQIAKIPREIFKAHPVFGWTLTPGKQVHVRFRDNVTQNVDSNGNRLVPNAGSSSKKRKLTFYGCSFTYGTCLADNETFASLLQDKFPDLYISNKGVGGNSSVQALLRFREDVKNNEVDYAVFGVISDHRYRNIPHPYRMKAYLTSDWYKLGVEQIPHAQLNRSGELEIIYTPIWQPAVANANFNVFLPDEHMLDLVTLAVFREILSIGKTANIPVIFALLDQLDPRFNQLVVETFPASCDVSTPYNETYTFTPNDLHPNVLANQIFANKLSPAIKHHFCQVGSE